MLTEIILEAWIALKRNYTRSLLTMLGIVWGIATVTLLIAYGNSFRNILVGGFDAFGKSVVIERRRVCFLGGRIREQLFSGRPAVGETVSIAGVRFTVVGVMARKIQL